VAGAPAWRLGHDPKAAWGDGTRHLLFGPVELLEKLAALIPRLRVNLVLNYGVLASHARWRSRVVGLGHSDPAAPDLPIAPEPSDGTRAAPRGCPRHWAWAQLMERAFGIDVLACPRCGGRLRLLATVEDPQVIRAVLESLGLPTEASPPHPP
jgi:hypothetical protein